VRLTVPLSVTLIISLLFPGCGDSPPQGDSPRDPTRLRLGDPVLVKNEFPSRVDTAEMVELPDHQA